MRGGGGLVGAGEGRHTTFVSFERAQEPLHKLCNTVPSGICFKADSLKMSLRRDSEEEQTQTEGCPDCQCTQPCTKSIQ